MLSIKRLVNLAGSDPGFYILAVHSYIEGYLKSRHSPIPFTDYGRSDFYLNMMELKKHMVTRQNGYNPALSCINDLAYEHPKTNDVRHEFRNFSATDATTTTQRFLRFCQIMEIDEEAAIAELETSLSHWQDRRSRKEEIEELKKYKWEAFRHQRDNKNLLTQIEEWQQKVKEYETLRLEQESSSAQLRHLEAKDEKLSDRVKELRAERNRLNLALKEKEKDLEKYKSAEEYSSHLQRIVSYTRTRLDYERMILRLTPEQEQILGRISLEGDFLIRGAAGTGKTFLLLEALKKAIKGRKESLDFSSSQENPFILLSYTRTLVKYNKYISHIMGIDDMSARIEDQIHTVDSFFYSLLKQVWDKDISFRLDFKAVQNLCGEYWQEEFFTPKQAASEIEDFIYPGSITKEEYLDEMISRKGRKVPLGRKQREKIWALLEDLEEKMLETGVLSKGFARKIVTENLERMSKGRAELFFVDEAQDLTPRELRILKALAAGGVILAGDLGQSIFTVSAPYSRSNLKIQGNSAILKTNFRSTAPIHSLAQAFRSGEEETRESSTFREGPRPELFTANTTEELYGLLIKRVRFLKDVLHYDLDNIFILTPNSSFENKVAKKLKEENLEAVQVKDESFDFMEADKIRLSPLPSSKGLDMPVVLLFLPRLFDLHSESYEDEVNTMMKKNLLYVCMTRAMDMLGVFMKQENEDEILQQLKGVLEEE